MFSLFTQIWFRAQGFPWELSKESPLTQRLGGSRWHTLKVVLTPALPLFSSVTV